MTPLDWRVGLMRVDLRDAAAWTADIVVRSYAQILFGSSRAVGAILLLATSVRPQAMLAGIAAIILAAAFARLLGFDHGQLRTGCFGYNALLVGLGSAVVLKATLLGAAVAAAAVLSAVLLTVLLQGALDRERHLPVLTLPFLCSFYLLLGVARVLLLERPPMHAALESQMMLTWLPWSSARLYLRSLGAIFFLPRVEAGLLVMLAIAVYSRLALVLSFVAFAVALAVLRQADMAWDGALPIVVGFNFILVAIGIGRVWLSAGWASFAYAMLALMISGFLTMGLLPILVRVGLPLLILPFNATVLCLLYVMQRRVAGAKPALQLPGTGSGQ